MSNSTLLTVHDSAARRFDPRVRMLWMFSLSVAVIAFQSLPSFGWLIIVVLLVWISVGVLREMLVFTVRALPFALFLTVLSILTALAQRHGAGILLTQPALWVPRLEDVSEAAVKATRFLVMVTAAKFLFLTTDFAEVSGGIRSLQRPWLGQRLNAFIEIFAFVVGFSFQSVPLIVNEMAAVIEAERGRGVDVNAGNRVTQVRNYLRMTPTLFLRCLTIGQFTIMALINYRFNPFARRTMYRRFALAIHDWAAVIIIMLGLIGLAIVKRRYPSL